MKLPDYRSSLQSSCMGSKDHMQEDCRPVLLHGGGAIMRALELVLHDAPLYEPFREPMA